ncbi:transcriptional regulator, TetR Family Member [Nautilia profundicola AmH]|uniref:Transcriptional regulator, TetR Family Member n=1 Tax=Nautilia profundicola (strain ATCC BAA-1463 / DSM 18972 / AmH) TaxID=598659 RepID=B9L848_NAUPA|nr:TetR/AcrR family transcriptional regulator [Nautilia profundicola]ACM93427.1 transcriptional regulator, TetR Family Member [Nautilia profundicola AmH]
MATKEDILKTALKLFANRGYENTSLEEVANKIGITKPAIYYYFKNKKALYNEIFIEKFSKLEFELKDSLEENLKEYIYKLGDFFIKNPCIAKLFSKEITSEAMHLEVDTLKVISKTLKHLTKILEKTNLNPFFIQTMVVSTFTTYANTLKVRERITGILKDDKLTKDFDITKEIYQTILHYIKAHK